MAEYPWPELEAQLDRSGYARLPALLRRSECIELRGMYDSPELFRKRVVMSRHGYGVGEYQYFKAPLPEPVATLRTALYPRLLATALGWQTRLGLEQGYPPDLERYLALCRNAGQREATPLLLRYDEGGYNCLHQDRYGELFFPLQVAVLLSRAGEEFSGGHFVLTEQRPRMQSRPHVVDLDQGDAVIFAGQWRPRAGVRGDHRVLLRHGVSEITRGQRSALGLVFHDAES